MAAEPVAEPADLPRRPEPLADPTPLTSPADPNPLGSPGRLVSFQGTVLAVTHDRWFAAAMDRFLVFGADQVVRESDEPVGLSLNPSDRWRARAKWDKLAPERPPSADPGSFRRLRCEFVPFPRAHWSERRRPAPPTGGTLVP